MARRPRIKSELLARIRELTQAGMRQNKIAERLGIHRNSVYRYQRCLGLPAWQTRADERKILRLVTDGLSQEVIAKQLGCGEYAVKKVMQKFGIVRPFGHPGYRWRPKAADYLRLMDLALSHKLSCKEISRVVGAPYSTTKKICHKILGAEKFLGGQPGRLESYEAMQHHPVLKTEESSAVRCLKIAARLTQIFAGQLPEDSFQRAVIFAGLMFRTIPVDLLLTLSPEIQMEVADRCVGEMVLAVRTLEDSRSHFVN